MPHFGTEMDGTRSPLMTLLGNMNWCAEQLGSKIVQAPPTLRTHHWHVEARKHVSQLSSPSAVVGA